MRIYGEDYSSLEEFFRKSEFSVDEELIDFAIKISEKYGLPISAGRQRTVWSTGSGYVIKVPKDESGDCANANEEWTHKRHDKFLGDYAKTRTFLVADRVICIAEYIEPASTEDLTAVYGDRKDWPLWIKALDCEQAGFNRDGQVKAFDFG